MRCGRGSTVVLFCGTCLPGQPTKRRLNSKSSTIKHVTLMGLVFTIDDNFQPSTEKQKRPRSSFLKIKGVVKSTVIAYMITATEFRSLNRAITLIQRLTPLVFPGAYVVVFSVSQQARFPDSRLERAASRPSQSSKRSVTISYGSFAIAGHSGGNRAGFAPTSLVSLTDNLRRSTRISVRTELNSDLTIKIPKSRRSFSLQCESLYTS